MSFERDRDAYTRGPGAIAALDGSPARRRRKALRARQTAARDRKMVAITRGALGVVSPAAPTNMVSVSIQPTRTPIPVRPMVTAASGPSGLLGSYTPTLPRPPVRVNGVIITQPVKQPGQIDPTGPSPTSPGDTSGSGVVSGGGGGGGGGGGSDAGVMVGGDTPPSFTQTPPDQVLPLPTDTPSSSGMSDTTKYLLIGGAVLGAFFLFTRRRGSSTEP